MSKINPKIIDQIFEGVDIPDDDEMRRQVTHQKRINANHNRWHNPEYKKKLKKIFKDKWDSADSKNRRKIVSETIKQFRKENPHVCTDEERAQKSKRAKEWHNKPENKKKYHEAIKTRDHYTPKAIEGKKKAGLKRRRKIQTPYGIFDSLQIAAEHFDIKPTSMGERLRSDKQQWKDWYYIGENNAVPKGPCKKRAINLTGKKIQTPRGLFANMRTAAKDYDVTPWTIKQWTKKYPNKFYIK